MAKASLPDRDPHLETAILEGGAHDRSITLALEASVFFEIPEAEARPMIREAARRISGRWGEALRQVGVSGALARDYEPAFANDQTEVALGLWSYLTSHRSIIVRYERYRGRVTDFGFRDPRLARAMP